MAIDKEMNETEKEILAQSDDTLVPGGKKTKAPKTNSFEMIGDLRIPVSSKRGKMWQSRVAAGKKKLDPYKDAWNEAIGYYLNDQTLERNGAKVKSSRIRKDSSSEIENIVFANISAATPRIYAQNPRMEITSNFDDPAAKDFGTVAERLCNVLINKNENPGLGLKAKVRRGVTVAQLTNLVWAEVDFVKKDESSEQAYADIKLISAQLEKAKDIKEIEELEAKLLAIDEKYDMLAPGGPSVTILRADEVIVDPNVTEHGFNDAMWMAKKKMFPTKFLEVKYMRKDKEGKQALIFKPDHIIKNKIDAEGEEPFSIFEKDSEPEAYGYTNKDDFENAKMSAVWYIWDKITRRVEMYLESDWKWPMWVWDDPLKLQRFFPFIPLSLVTPVIGPYSKGEVSYYLDQQDAINDINEHQRLARRWARHNVWFNSNYIDDVTMAKVLEGGSKNGAHGLKLPEGVKVEDVIYSILPPGSNFMSLFDKSPQYAAIDRVAPVNEVARGGQYKTNTTNKAIDQYSQSRTVRTDDKVDMVEDWITEIMWSILQLCLMNYDEQSIVPLLGPIDAKTWGSVAPLPPEQINATISSFQAASGSTQKPNSREKKENAMEMSQVLGQFASSAPAALIVSLKALENAFDEVVIKEEDWALIRQSIEAQIGIQTADAAKIASEGGLNAQQAAMQEQQMGAQEQQAQPIDPAMVEEYLATLPPEVGQQIAQIIQSGVDPVEAITQVTGQPPPF